MGEALQLPGLPAPPLALHDGCSPPAASPPAPASLELDTLEPLPRGWNLASTPSSFGSERRFSGDEGPSDERRNGEQRPGRGLTLAMVELI